MGSRLLENKVSLITGAAMGIGEATALAFAREGARVVLSDTSSRAHEVVARIREAGGQAQFIAADVSKPADVEALIAGTVKAFGRLDIAFNNAGISGEQAPVADLTSEGWATTLGVNLSGVFYCSRRATAGRSSTTRRFWERSASPKRRLTLLRNTGCSD